MHNAFYFGQLKLADATSEPCAQLNYGWFARNALTFSKIAATTTRRWPPPSNVSSTRSNPS